MNIPKKLQKDTIFEAVFEIRFVPRDENAADLFPGLLYNDLKSEFPKTESLPITQLPKEIVKLDENLKYQPTQRFHSDAYIASFGPRVFSVSCKRPYQGWKEFRKKIEWITNLVEKTQFVKTVERYSIKYVNVIPKPAKGTRLSRLQVSLEVGGFPFHEEATQIRTEILHKGILNIVQILPGVNAKVGASGEEVEGILFDVDSIQQSPDPTFLAKPMKHVDAVHAVEKEIYFGLLSKETLEGLGPEY